MHRIALVVLWLTAGVHLVVLAREQAASPTPGYDHVIFVASLWLLVLWKVGSRAWGRGVGVVLLLLGTGFVHWWYQSWEKWRGMGGQMDFAEALRYLPVEALLLVVAGFFCLLVPSAPPEREGEDEGSEERVDGADA